MIAGGDIYLPSVSINLLKGWKEIVGVCSNENVRVSITKVQAEDHKTGGFYNVKVRATDRVI